ncbi:MAG: hypothetical protein ACOYNS_17510, partial [Bacteroidota bacterium]
MVKKIPRTILRSIILQSSIFILFVSGGMAQEKDTSEVWLNEDWYYGVHDSTFFDTSSLLPELFQHQVKLKEYLRDPRFYSLRRAYNDTLAVDAIFDRAMLLAEGNVKEALWISLFSVMEHRSMGFRVPLIGTLYIPLTLESDSLFKLRRTNLPKKVLNDKVVTSDKDKLQHFFGSAFLAYETNSNTFVEWVGNLLELGENKFVVGGNDDPRDRAANAKG